MNELLRMNQISKSFGGVQVLNGVDFSVSKGEIHALLGENGAGKSTLMNILTGVIPMDRGEVFFDGKKLEHITVSRSESAGIAFVHQELNLINDLKVFENLYLNREICGKFGCLHKKKMKETAKGLFSQLGVDIDPDAMVSSLKISEKQIVEISKALFLNAKLIILDEPTTALNNDETAHLFSILRNLKERGTSFIFISHKMPEIFALSDRYTVLRGGVFIKEGEISKITPDEITRFMVGDNYYGKHIYKERELGKTVLELDGFSGKGFSNITLTVKKGEILGITGLQGSGCSEFMQGIFGSCSSNGGRLSINGTVVTTSSIHKAMQSKIAMLPTDRKENSVVPDMTILENMYIAEHTLSAGRFHIMQKKEIGRFEKQKSALNIKSAGYDLPITALSGGNQQKVFLARWLNTDAELLLFDNPTQGIDVGAKSEIYRLILKLAQAGKTILVNTLEIPELQQIADRCVIFYEGENIKILQHDEINEHAVMAYATNAAGRKEIS